MNKIDEIIPFFETGLVKAVGCMAGSAVSFLASSSTEGIASGAAGVTGWALAVSCIVVLAKTVKRLFEKLEEKDLAQEAKLATKDARIESLQSELLKAARDEDS